MNRAPHQDTVDPELAPVLVPTDRPRRPGVASRCSAVEHAELAAGTAPVGTGRDELLLAGFAALLHRCTGQGRIGLVQVDRTGRSEQIRLSVTADSTLQDIVNNRASGPTFPTVHVAIRFAPAEEITPAREAPWELQLVVRSGTCGRNALELHYDTALFDRTTAARLLAHYRTLMEDATRFPDRRVAQLRLLDDALRRRMLVEWNRTETHLPHETCLHQAFEARADRTPDATAVVHGSERWTYGRINAAANRLAHHLRSLGVGPDVRVGLCLDRSPGLLVSVLGILKAGGAYVPIDPDYPARRIAAMVGATSCAVMISREALSANLPGGSTKTQLLLLDRDDDVIAARPEHDLGVIAEPDNLCYIIHTSGSTGAPKPIALRHRGVMNNLADLNSRFRVGPGDSVLALSSPSFDMSVYEFLGMTIAGGTVVVPEAERAKDPAHWAELLIAHHITVWNSAPALLGLLVDHLEHTGPRQLPQLRLAMLGGDWVPVTLPDRVRSIAPGLRLIVMGGATEASIHSTLYEVEATDPGWTSIPYGRPMANQRAYILDEARQPVPPGVPGELYLAGIGLARGYLDQPERTAERFIDWSHGEVTSERLYRTGDLARFDADGLIELLGRMDFQVKINGLRVELGEIEAVLRTHAGVRQVAVIAREGRLIAYAVPVESHGALVDELRDIAADRLPEYMVPRAFVTLEELPLTPNGKLDRRNLPEPAPTGAVYRAPQSATEQALAEVFAEVLGLNRIGVDDDFLAQGGDSVRAIQVVTRARTRGLEITPRQLFEHRTVATLAAVATGTDPAVSAGMDVTAPLVDVDRADIDAWTRHHPRIADVWPLTAMQSGMLFESMLNDTGDDTYQMQTVYHLCGQVDAVRMRSAGQALLQRHANLRVAFVPDTADNLVQIVVDGVELPWREIDLSGLAADGRTEAFQRFLAEDRAVRFDLATPPLLRMALVILGPGRTELVVTAHHALLDGWSEQVLARHLQQLYAADGDASALEPVRDFRDFLVWLSQRDDEESARAWAVELAGVDGPTLLTPPTASPAPAAGVGEIVVTLPEDEAQRLAACCAQLGVTVNTLVQGAWAVLLSALTGRTDVVFGATVSGRPGALTGVESMVGLFINTVPVRVRCAPGATVAELLSGLRDRQSALLEHHHHSLSDIHRATGLDALFDTLVVFQSFPAPLADAGAAGVEVTGVDSLGTVSYPLALFVEPGRLTLQYRRPLYDEATAADITARFRSVLNQLAASPSGRVGEVDLLLATEHERIVGQFNDTAATEPRAHDTLPALFERQAVRTPDAVAVVSEGTSLTYGELDARADRLARVLIRRGLGPESVVALALTRPVPLAVALLGTLKSGAAYAMTDPTWPEPDAVLRDAGAALTLTTADIDSLRPADDTHPADRVRRTPLLAQHLACLRLPSRPGRTASGVAVSHQALVNGVLRFASCAGVAQGTRMLAASSHPDAVAFEMLAGLCAGAGVEVVEDAAAFGGRDGWKGDVISTVIPSFTELLHRSPGVFEAGTVVFTGDVLPASFVRRVREAMPAVRIVSTYGRTETVRTTAFTDTPPGTGAALGAPLGAMRCYVLGPALQLLPAGVTGELYVAGALARGYPGNSALTAERFVADLYGPPGARMYRTGDLARWNSAGLLEYAGRSGSRARTGGRWVRTDDVEAVLAAHPGVSQAVVVARGNADGGDDQLIGYAVPLRDGDGSEDLRAYAARRLPDHMAPAIVVTLEELPSAADGTVDRDALPAPGAGSADGGYRKGRTPREEALCELFAEVIGVDRVGIDDNFIAIGVTSLMAGKLVGRMHRTLGLKASIRSVFRYPTIAKLSGQLQAVSAPSRPGLRRMSGR